jgi:hypothetical protein
MQTEKGGAVASGRIYLPVVLAYRRRSAAPAVNPFRAGALTAVLGWLMKIFVGH